MKYVGIVTDLSWLEARENIGLMPSHMSDELLHSITKPVNGNRIYSDEHTMAKPWRISLMLFRSKLLELNRQASRHKDSK